MSPFYHRKYGQIEYHEVEGSLWYSYQRKDDISPTAYYFYSFEGEIPSDIVAQGTDAIRSYATKQIERAVSDQERRIKEREAFCRNPDVPVEVMHKGVLLKGRIFRASVRHIEVRLEFPYEGELTINFGWASAIQGRYVLNEQGFTADAIKSAQRLLIRMAEKAVHRDVHREVYDLLDDLNEDSN